ncbi:hypothetical protein [Limosilactobacillus reuteri]|uniref:hypothetical protein n=1 Tax=Limosilactobacillus reuteri TaxID=1598 RepID=UPI0039940F24
MHILTLHSFLSLSWDEWASIVAILTAIVIIARSLIKKTKDDIFEPINRRLDKFNESVDFLVNWQDKANARLEKGAEKFVKHEEQLKDHERRITSLEERNK